MLSPTPGSKPGGRHDLVHRQRQAAAGRRPTGDAAALGPPRVAQPDGDQVRLRHRCLRGLYRPRRRHRRSLVRHAGLGGRGATRDHDRGSVRARRSSGAARVDGSRRPAVRLLSVRPDHVRGGASGAQGRADRRRHRRRDVRQHLPLRNLSADPGRDPSRRRAQEGRRVMTTLVSRREILKSGLAVGAGLTLGFTLPRRGRAQTPGVFMPHQWLRIDRDGVVTITNSLPQMGQGSLTTTPMIIADELDATLDSVKVEQAPANPALYKNPVTGSQSYGGSRGVRDHREMRRKAAAAARDVLAQAAADEWGVPVESVETEQGAVVHRPSGRRLLYGQLVDRAQQVPVPQNPTLKSPDKFRYIGKPVKRRDTPEKITGRGIYGTDVQVPGMLVASIERCPVFGGKVKSFDATAATRVKGVKHVVQVSNGIAVVADGFWTALQGRRALRVTWDEGPMAQVSSTMITREYEAAAKQPGQVARNDGDAEKVLAAGGRVHEAVYQVPFLEHACMEPMNATAQVMPDACVVWAPTQNPGGTQATAARLTGLPPEKVTVHTTLLGGGFGRRGEQDFIVDAVETSKAVRAPVKVMWTREDDITHGFYRPATYNLFRATLDARGVPAAWFTRMVGPGILILKGS